MFKFKKLSAYLNRSLNRSHVKLNRKVTGSRKSILEDIYAGLEICFGPDYLNRLESKLASPDFKGSEEQKILAQIIQSVTDEPLRGDHTEYIGDSDPVGSNTVGAFVSLVASLKSEMAKLEPDERALLWDKHVEGKTYRQLSAELGVPRSTLQDRVTQLTRLLLDSLTVEVNDLT